MATIIGPFFIPFLHRLKFGQAIREEGPQSHRKKSGTPTMGGIIFITSIVVILLVAVLFTKYTGMTNELMMLLLTLVGFGLIGFIDDFIIVVRKNNEGLKPKQKLLAQLVLAAVFFYLFLKSGYSTELSFFNLFSVNLHWLYGLFILFWMVGFSNAVNLTDGLDGLCGGVSVITFGDTGSLALGAAIAAVSILLKQELLLVIIGLVYVIETLSVIIQVAYYKRTKKRLFKMAPIHHHFELCGWSEWKVVIFLWSVTLVCAAIGLVIAI